MKHASDCSDGKSLWGIRHLDREVHHSFSTSESSPNSQYARPRGRQEAWQAGETWGPLAAQGPPPRASPACAPAHCTRLRDLLHSSRPRLCPFTSSAAPGMKPQAQLPSYQCPPQLCLSPPAGAPSRPVGHVSVSLQVPSKDLVLESHIRVLVDFPPQALSTVPASKILPVPRRASLSPHSLF